MSDTPPIDAATRESLYTRSLDDPDGFWLEQAKRLDWIETPTKAGDWSFDESDFHVRWFEDGVLNISPTAWIATWKSAVTRSRSCGNPTSRAKSHAG